MNLWVDCAELYLQAIAVDITNAPIEQQDLVVTVSPDPMPLSPGKITVVVGNGRPGGQLTLIVVGNTHDPVEVDLDESGGTTVSVPVKVAVPGIYTLTAGVVTGGVGAGLLGDGLVGDPTADVDTADPYADTARVTFNVLDVDTDGAIIVPPLVPPPAVQPATGVKRWVFQDPFDGGETYHFHYNPNAMRSPFAAKAISSTPTTAIDGQVLAFESMATPAEFEFDGFIRTQDHYEALLHWKNKRHRVWLTDHFGRAWLVYVKSFDPIPTRDNENYWSHNYSMSCLIFAGPVTPTP